MRGASGNGCPYRDFCFHVYDNLGRLTRTNYPDGSFTRSQINGENRLTGVTDAESNTFSFYYDPCGNMTEIVRPLGHAQYQDYDYLNRKIASGRRESHNGVPLN